MLGNFLRASALFFLFHSYKINIAYNRRWCYVNFIGINRGIGSYILGNLHINKQFSGCVFCNNRDNINSKTNEGDI